MIKLKKNLLVCFSLILLSACYDEERSVANTTTVKNANKTNTTDTTVPTDPTDPTDPTSPTPTPPTPTPPTPTPPTPTPPTPTPPTPTPPTPTPPTPTPPTPSTSFSFLGGNFNSTNATATFAPDVTGVTAGNFRLEGTCIGGTASGKSMTVVINFKYYDSKGINGTYEPAAELKSPLERMLDKYGCNITVNGVSYNLINGTLTIKDNGGKNYTLTSNLTFLDNTTSKTETLTGTYTTTYK